jgi:hypothetical protein
VAATLDGMTVKELQATTKAHPETAARVEAMKARLADLWPASVIALGGVLTVIWTGGLVWLAVKLLAFF